MSQTIVCLSNTNPSDSLANNFLLASQDITPLARAIPMQHLYPYFIIGLSSKVLFILYNDPKAPVLL